jgi:hypothetical protein
MFAVALIQGVYFVATGVWPLVSIRTFMAITGPKTISGWSKRSACW